MLNVFKIGGQNCESSSGHPKKVEILRIHYPADQKYPPHYDRQGRISIVLRGRVQETVSKKEEIGTSLSVVMKPESVLHSNEFGRQGALLLTLMMSPEFQSQMEMDYFLKQWQWWHSAQTTRIVIDFLRDIQLDKDLESGVIEFLAALAIPKQRPSNYRPLWLTQLCDKIETECSTPLLVADLAYEFGVHPVYLARVFRKFYGCNIKTYIHQCRLRKLNLHLADSDLSIAQIALEGGYADQSHFTRKFKSQTGLTPAAFRRLIHTF